MNGMGTFGKRRILRGVYGLSPMMRRHLNCFTSTPLAAKHLTEGFNLIPDFVTEEEESALVSEIDQKLLRRKYVQGHWDAAIVNFREMEKHMWQPENERTIQRIISRVFDEPSHCQASTHVLDLSAEGHIKPHIDSIKFCGSLVSGVSLLSEAVMRFRLDEKGYADVILPRRSLYVMKREIRYTYTHEILPNIAEVNGMPVYRSRRVTIMKRSNENCHCEEFL